MEVGRKKKRNEKEVLEWELIIIDQTFIMNQIIVEWWK